MKKLPILVYTLVLFVLLSACKKGEDDPIFSFKTRKARVEGEWKMREGSLNVGVKDSTGSYSAMVYDLGESKYNLDVIGKGAHFEEDCSLTLSFTKKGEFVMTQTMDSLEIKATGNWDFQGKVGESKKKEKINIQLNTINNNSSYFRTFNKSQMNFNYRIKELRSKRMVLVCEEEKVVADSGFSIIVTAEYVLEQ